jgi:hypothetical protein
MSPAFDRSQKLFLVLSGFFVANAILAEFIGVKIFALEDTLGSIDRALVAVRQQRLAELHCRRAVVAGGVRDDRHHQRILRPARRAHHFLAGGRADPLRLPIRLRAMRSNRRTGSAVAQSQGVPDMQAAFVAVFGQGLWTIAGSVTAFLFAQLIDVAVFHRIRRTDRRTLAGPARDRFDPGFAVLRQLHRALHRLRARTATMADRAVSRVGTVNYLYKSSFALAATRCCTASTSSSTAGSAMMSPKR